MEIGIAVIASIGVGICVGIMLGVYGSMYERGFLKKYYEHTLSKQDSEIKDLKQKYEDAKNLKSILELLQTRELKLGDYLTFNSAGFLNVEFPDSVLQYVDDMVGGKVIRQDAVKCIKIDKTGNVQTGLTKKADKGYSYKLIRE